MTTVPNFDIATDLKVEFYLPIEEADLFTIGISKLNSQDVLADLGLFTLGDSLLGSDDVLGDNQFLVFSWQDLACVASAANISLGGQIQDQLYFQPEPASAQITLQTFDYDPSYNPAFRPGVPIRIRLVKGAVDEIIWSGIIDSISGSYSVEGKNLLQLTAFDNFKKLVNTRIDLFDSDTDFPAGYVSSYEQLELIAEQFGTAMHSSSSDPGGEIPSTILTDVIPSDLIYEAIKVGLGLFWLDPTTQEFVLIPRPTPGSVPLGTPVIGNNHGSPYHLCMTNIETLSNTDVLYNSLKVILESDDTIFTIRENVDSAELYGKYAQDVTLNTTDLTELNRWADLVFDQSPTSLVQSVETLTKDREGTLTEAAFFLPGQLVGVDYSEDVLTIDEYYTITRVSHSITTETWITTLDLWKEV